MTKADQIQDLEKQIVNLRELRRFDQREKERLRNEIAYWKGFVPAHILKSFPFPQDKPAEKANG